MQNAQKSCYRVVSSKKNKGNNRFPLHGSSKEMFDLDYKHHAERMKHVTTAVDTRPPTSKTTPPPWTRRPPEVMSADSSRTRFREPWQVSDSRNESNIPEDSLHNKSGTETFARGSSATRKSSSSGRLARSGSSGRLARPKSAASSWSSSKNYDSLGQSANRSLNVQTQKRSYTLNETQAKAFENFTEMLSGFDTFCMLDILEDALNNAQEKTIMADFNGTNEYR
jgi:hypothetical protein